MAKYFVEFTDGSSPFFTQDAVDFEDMIIQLARYTGTYCHLFEKALKGLTSEKEMVNLFNVFSSWEIERILKIERIAYTKER